MKMRPSTFRAAQHRRRASNHPPTDSRRICALIVDDSPLVTQSFESFLKRQAGFEVVGTAATGLEAVQQAAELRPDLVLIDIQMPVMDGLEATRRIKGHEKPPVVIMFTAEDGERVRAAAKAAGADGFVVKAPRMFEALQAAIGRAFPG